MSRADAVTGDSAWCLALQLDRMHQEQMDVVDHGQQIFKERLHASFSAMLSDGQQQRVALAPAAVLQAKT